MLDRCGGRGGRKGWGGGDGGGGGVVGPQDDRAECVVQVEIEGAKEREGVGAEGNKGGGSVKRRPGEGERRGGGSMCGCVVDG